MSTSLSYQAGSASSPSDPFGQEILSIDDQGRFTYQRSRQDQRWSCSGQIEISIVRKMFSALQAGGFPEVPQHSIPPGASLVTISIHNKGREIKAHLDMYKGERFPGYSDVLRWGAAWTGWLRTQEGDAPAGLTLQPSVPSP